MATAPDGVFAALLTPLKPDLSIDHEALLVHARRLLSHGCDGLVLLGTTGEANSLSIGQRLHVLKKVADGGLPLDRFIVGTGCCALEDTFMLSRHALALGFKSLLFLPPFYYKGVSDEGLFAYFDTLIQRLGTSDLEAYLYHIPPISQVGFSHGLIDRLLQTHPATVVGLKDSSGDVAHMTGLCRAFPSLRVYAGNERYLLDLLRAGGVGSISSTANIMAHEVAQVYARWQEHAAGAEAQQAQVSTLRQTITAYPAIAALKTLMAEALQDPRWLTTHPPLMALTNEQATALKDDLQALSFSPPWALSSAMNRGTR